MRTRLSDFILLALVLIVCSACKAKQQVQVEHSCKTLALEDTLILYALSQHPLQTDISDVHINSSLECVTTPSHVILADIRKRSLFPAADILSELTPVAAVVRHQSTNSTRFDSIVSSTQPVSAPKQARDIPMWIKLLLFFFGATLIWLIVVAYFIYRQNH